MGITTGIEWVDSTSNPAMGCDGCELWPGDDAPKEKKRCYAGTLTNLHGGPSRPGWPEAFGKPKIFPDRIRKALSWSDLTGKYRADKPWLNGYPRTIFLGDMGDNHTESLDLMWMAPHIEQMAASPHVWINLTKRPARMFEFWHRWCRGDHNTSPLGAYRQIPKNFWLLTSVTSAANINRIRELQKLRDLGASVLGVSYEPAWGPVDWEPLLSHMTEDPAGSGGYIDIRDLDWLISGGESGTGARPSLPDWFRSARDACVEVGTSYFHKQNGEFTVMPHTGNFAILPDGGFFRDCPSEDLERAVANPGAVRMSRVGKKAAGSLLDGQHWRQMPRISA